MPETERDLSILQHIVSYCEDIENAVSRFGDGIEAFASDKDYRNACAMRIPGSENWRTISAKRSVRPIPGCRGTRSAACAT